MGDFDGVQTLYNIIRYPR